MAPLDGSHRILTITDPRGITFLQNEYDPATGRVTRQTQADGGVWSLAYTLTGNTVTQTVFTDPRGDPTTYRFTPDGFPLSTTDALGQTTVYAYAPGSNLLLSTTDPLGRVTRFSYDAQGNVLTITDPAGNVRAFTYEPTFNRVTSIRDPLGNVTSFGYDAQGNLTALTDPLGATTAIAYNAVGQPVSTTDPLVNTTAFGYDGVGNLTTITDPLGNTTTRTYDAVSRLIEQMDPRGMPSSVAYTALNQPTQIRDALGGLTGFSYDGNGNLLTVTDARNNTTAHSYDSMDRLQTRTDPVGATESFQYDGVGNLTRQTDRKGQVSTFSYDGLNRRSGATYADGSATTLRYDAGGRLIQAVDSAGGTILNQFDVLDRLLALQTALGTVAYQYDAAGRRTQMTAPGQALTSYTYDAASRLTQIAQGGQVASVQYDAAGRRSRLTLPNQVSTEYQYDAGSQLAALIYRNATGQLGDLTYQYDPAGNRTGIGGSFARTGFPSPVASASYSAANQQVSFGSQLLTYDPNGNLTSDGANLYTWNARNQLLAITGPGVTATFSYDAVGRRQSRSVNGASTQFLYDGLNPVQEAGTTGIATLLTGLGIDEYLTRTDAAGARTLVTDALGSTVALTDAAGVVQTQYKYEPFGATAVTGPTDANAFQYTGRENDGTGLYYYRARYYHPGLQRFVSEDPIGLVAGANLYSYANNNPVNFTDPLGLCRVEARFSHLSLGYHHAFVVTTDPNGTQNYYRGGPTTQGPSGGSSGALSSASGGAASGSMTGRKSGSNSGNSSSPGSGPGGSDQDNGPWGQIATTYGPYTPRSIDWDPTASSMTVLDNNASCGPYDARFGQIMRDIQNASIPYNPFTTNSNAVAREALERAGLNPGRPPVWAPGWNTRLP